MKQTVLILGASSDIAIAAAHALGQKGYNLQLAGRRVETLESLGKTLTTLYDTHVEVVYFDALDYDSHASFYAQLPLKPNAVVCAFGHLTLDPENQLTKKETDLTLHSNFTGAVSILNRVAEDFRERKEGVIVGVSSVAADRGKGSNVTYGAAKAGFDTYLAGLRNLLHKDGVRVVTIRPGFVDTKMITHMETPGPLTASKEQVGKVIAKALTNNRNIVYVKPIWRLVMLVIKSIPEPIFKKLGL